MSRKCKSRRAMADLNVVPYIDVMLVLLVIFMVTAPMLQSGVKIDLPDADAKPLESNKNKTPIFITVNEFGNYFDNEGAQIRLSELSSYLVGQLENDRNSAQSIRPVYIRGDQNVAYRYLMQAMVAAQQAGAQTINLMADPLINK